ncbi:MAG TPA: hypothetical protein VF179_05295 [Thermoanaerobaculia bacterium]|nr:hypothetical protein [Thermoanaerobaculia bacterium]
MATDLRADQRWRLANGTEIKIGSVDGDHISGYSNPIALSGDNPAPSSGALAVYEGHRADFEGATLLAPLWQVRTSVDDGGLVEEISRLISSTGTIEHRSSSSENPADGSVNFGLATYTIHLAAADSGAAEQTVRDALGNRLRGEIHVEPL